jgi:hypothetical protein
MQKSAFEGYGVDPELLAAEDDRECRDFFPVVIEVSPSPEGTNGRGASRR